MATEWMGHHGNVVFEYIVYDWLLPMVTRARIEHSAIFSGVEHSDPAETCDSNRGSIQGQ